MAALASASCALALPTRASADPPILTSVAGTCDPTIGTSSYTTTPVTGTHDDLDWRLSTDGGPGSWQGVTPWDEASTFWGSGESLPDGSAASGTVHCESASATLHYEIDWYDRPTPPATFSGSLASDQRSTFGVHLPERGGYVVSNGGPGAVLLLDDSGSTLIPPLGDGGLLAIGDAGPADFDVQNGGATSPFSIAVGPEEAPTVFSDGLDHVSTSQPATPLLLRYELNVPAHVKAQLMAPDNVTPIRTLLDSQEDGDFSLVWDLRDPSGALEGDGRYSIDVTATNSAGTYRLYDLVFRDTLGPTISIKPPQSEHFPLEVRVGDISGVKSANVVIDGVATPFTGFFLLRKPLSLGTHTVSVSATDRLGHVSSAVRTFTVPKAPPPLTIRRCDATQAKIFVRHTRSVATRLRRLARLGKADVFKGFALRQVVCGGVSQHFFLDMAVLLKARHGMATPLLFVRSPDLNGPPTGSWWRLGYISTKPRIVSIAWHGPHLFERRRVGRRKSRIVRLAWNGHTLVQVRK